MEQGTRKVGDVVDETKRKKGDAGLETWLVMQKKMRGRLRKKLYTAWKL